MRSYKECRSALGFIALALPLIGFSGCVVTDMKNTTQQMAGDTQKMGKSLDQTNTTLDHTSETLTSTSTNIDNTYTDLRPDQAVQVRDHALVQLNQDSTVESKLADAGIYVMALEFQLFKGNISDTQEKLEMLYRDGLEEFFARMSEYLSRPADLVSPVSTDRSVENLLAFSYSMDRVYTNAKIRSEKQNIKEVSVHSLIQDVLKSEHDIESTYSDMLKQAGDDRSQADAANAWYHTKENERKPYELQVLYNRDRAVALLETRANFLPTMMVGKITHIQEHNKLEQVWQTFTGTPVDFTNVQAMTQALEFIRLANAQVDFLKSIGNPPRYDFALQKLITHLKLPKAVKSPLTIRDQIGNSLIQEIEQYKLGFKS